MMKNNTLDLLEVGVIIGTHGLRGDLKIRLLPTGNLALPDARTVYIKDAEGLPIRYSAVRTTPHKNLLLLRLSGLDDLAGVEKFVGSAVFMDTKDLPPRDDDLYYWPELEGAIVVDRKLGEIGRVVGMFSTPAHDILEVDGHFDEVLVPAIKPFLVKLEPDHGVLHVDLPEGLVGDPKEKSNINP